MKNYYHTEAFPETLEEQIDRSVREILSGIEDNDLNTKFHVRLVNQNDPDGPAVLELTGRLIGAEDLAQEDFDRLTKVSVTLDGNDRDQPVTTEDATAEGRAGAIDRVVNTMFDMLNAACAAPNTIPQTHTITRDDGAKIQIIVQMTTEQIEPLQIEQQQSPE